jgi:hypothetical protein
MDGFDNIQKSISQASTSIQTSIETAKTSLRKITGADRKTTNPSLKAIAQFVTTLTNADKTTNCSLKQQLFKLNDYPNGRYSPELMTDRLILKYKDPQKIMNALESLELGDSRFNGTDDNFELDKDGLEVMKERLEKAGAQRTREKTDDKVGNAAHENLPASMETNPNRSDDEVDIDAEDGSSVPVAEDQDDDDNSASSGLIAKNNEDMKTENKEDEKKVKKRENKIATDIVGCLIIRKPVDQKFDKSSTTMTQVQGHLGKDGEGNPVFVKGKAISAEVQKKETPTEIANHGHIVLTNREDGTSQVVLSRSSRTDTVGKVVDKSKADILARLNCMDAKGQAHGLTKGSDGVYSYQRSDVTLMDTSIIKSFNYSRNVRLKNRK